MEKNKNTLVVATNKIKVNDSGDGKKVLFNKPLPITSNTKQYNGTVYDIDSMDISNYKGLITIDHSDSIKDVVGRVVGLKKNSSTVTIDGIEFATEQSALAMFARDMLLSGFVTDLSIETVGPWPDDEGIYYNSELIGLSLVIVGNNKLATVNELAIVAFNSAKASNIDTHGLEDYIKVDNITDIQHNVDMKYVTVKNSRDFAVMVSYKNSADENIEVELKPGQGVDVSEDQVETITTIIDEAKKPEEKAEVKPEVKTDEVSNAILAKLEKLEKTVFDNSAKEPTFKKEINIMKTENELKGTHYKERAAKQINYAWDYLKGGSQDAAKKLNDLNEFHLEELKKEGKVANAITISDFGNFVISPELLRDIEGTRSNFQPLLSKVDFRDTLSLQMAYLKRSGDISMDEVETCDDGADGNLKPISEYTADIATSNLHELAAVTPVCNAATRFLAVDLLTDVTAGYRTDFDRKKAQLLIARLQQAVNATGYKVAYNRTTAVTGLTSWINMLAKVTEEVGDGGLFVINYKTKSQIIKDAIEAGVSGPLSSVLMTGDLSPILGQQTIVVPNELMPTLNSAETKTFTIEGSAVTINQGVFYFDPSTFSGRTSGGLNFDLSTEASYEVNGAVKSAFQRNELVLRGSFFRGGVIRDTAKVSSMFAAGIS